MRNTDVQVVISIWGGEAFQRAQTQMLKTELNKKTNWCGAFDFILSCSMADPQQSPALAYTSVSHVCVSVKISMTIIAPLLTLVSDIT